MFATVETPLYQPFETHAYFLMMRVQVSLKHELPLTDYKVS